jgi:hypothetical protein
MSRSKKKGKSPGYEYWGKRALSAATPGRYTKTRTHRMERKQSKRLAKIQEEEESE